MATTKKTSNQSKNLTYPYSVVGTHLTVTHYEDGRTELAWDDEQLLKEVREAISNVEGTDNETTKIKGEKNVKTRKTRKSK